MEKVNFGQIGYEGYCAHTGYKSLATGDNLPKWEDLRPSIQEAWNMAADSIIAAYTPIKYKLLK